MDLNGGKIFDIIHSRFANGDKIVISENNDCPYPGHMNEKLELIETIGIPARYSLTTMNRYSGAGFYVHEWGPMPFSIGHTPHIRYLIFQFYQDYTNGQLIDKFGADFDQATKYYKILQRMPYAASVYVLLADLLVQKKRF